MPRPKRYDDSVREALIVEAAAMIAAAGPDGVVLRPLAATCGCTTSTIYSMFGNRDNLIAAVREYVANSFTASQQEVRTTEGPIADLTSLGRAYRAWAIAHPTLYQVMFDRRADPDCPPSELPSDASIRPLLDAVQRAVDSGELSGGRVDQISRSIWAGVHGWAMLELNGMTPSGPRKSVTEYELHLRSLLAAWRQQ